MEGNHDDNMVRVMYDQIRVL